MSALEIPKEPLDEAVRAAREEMAEGRFFAALPRLCAVLGEEGDAAAEAWSDLTRCLLAVGEEDLARQAEARPSSPEEKRLFLGLIQFRLGCRLEDQKEHGAAAEAFRAALLLADQADDKVAYAGRAADALARAGDPQAAYRLLLPLESEVRKAEDPDSLAIWAFNLLQLHHELGGKGEPSILREIRHKLPPELPDLPALDTLPDAAGVDRTRAFFERMLEEDDPLEVESRHRQLLGIALLKGAQGALVEASTRLQEAEALEAEMVSGYPALDRRVIEARLLSHSGEPAEACAVFAEIYPRFQQGFTSERRLEVAGYYLEALGRWAAPEGIPAARALVGMVIDLYGESLLRQPGGAARRQVRRTYQRVFEAALLTLVTLTRAAGPDSATGQLLLSRAWNLVLLSRNPELQAVPAPPSEAQVRRLRRLEDALHRALRHEIASPAPPWSWLSLLEKVTAYEISTLRTASTRKAEIHAPPERGVAVAFFQFRDLTASGLLALIAHEGRFQAHPIRDADDAIALLTEWARNLRDNSLDPRTLRKAKRHLTCWGAEAADESMETVDLATRRAAEVLLLRDLPGLDRGTEAVPWYVFPDGELHTLPFEVIPDADGRPLGRHLSLRFCLRSSVPAMCEAKIDFTRGWLGLGGAPALTTPVVNFEYLPGTLHEISLLQNHLAALGYPAESLVNEAAHARHLAERLAVRRPSVLHLAVHGCANSEHPDACALILAAAPGTAEKELLPFRRIRDLPLEGVQLVVLSTCSSLIGPSDKSAGIEGLAWAFLQAGAAQVIASRYPVRDAETCRLMQMLYHHLLDHPVAEALRRMRTQAEEEIDLREIGAWAVWS